jgi:outer membrane protein assembly factor BamB
VRRSLFRFFPLALAFGFVLAAAPAGAGGPSIVLDPTSGPPTAAVDVTGQGFGSVEVVALTMGPISLGSATTDAAGSFAATVQIPAAARPGSRSINAVGQTSGLTGQASFLVRASWRQFGFDDDHTRVNPYENVLNPRSVRRMRLHWQAQLGSPVYGSSPAVVDGVAYIGSSEGSLWAVDANGCGVDLCTTPLWRGDLGAQTLSSPTVANGFVYIGSQTSFTDNDGKLDVFDVAGCGQAVCQPLWKGLAGASSGLESSPAVTADMAYIASYDGHLFAFDANGCGQAVCPPVWRGTLGGPSDSSPVVHDGVVYVGATDGKLYAFDANGCGQANCQALWTGSVGPASVFSGSPAIADGLVYIASQKKLGAFPVGGCGGATCQPVWKADAGIDFFNGSPAVYHDRLFIPLENDLAVYDASGCGQATCTPLYRDFASGAQASILSSPAVANGVVYVGRNTAEVLAFKAAGCGNPICPTIWRGTTNDQIVDSSPAVVNGKLYIGSTDKFFPESISGRLYVFDLP